MRAKYVALAVFASMLSMVAVSQTASAQESDDFSNTVRVRAEYFLYDDSVAVAQDKIARTLDKAKESGADTIDTEVVWATVDQGDWGGNKRTYDWSYIDYTVKQAEVRGLKVNMMLTTTPDWVHPTLANSVQDKEARRWTAPRGATELQHYSNFVKDVTLRYKGRIGHYEIWNEQNHTPFWRSGPNPAQYAALLRTAYFDIKEADPNAKVMFGGLALNNIGYVEAYYKAVKANYPNAAENGYFFDIMGVHPYVHPNRANLSPDRYTKDVVGPLDDENYDFIGTVDGNFLGFKKIKATMDAQGDTGKTMFFSEFGYEVKDGVITDARRAFYLKRAYELAMETPYVDGMAWYAFRATRYADPESWTLLDTNLNPNRTFRAYTETFSSTSVVRSTSSTATTPPAVGVKFTAQGGAYTISSSVSGLDVSNITNWELYRDGEIVKEAAGGKAFYTEMAATEVSGRKFMLAAYTKSGSVWHSGPQSPGSTSQDEPSNGGAPGPEASNTAPRITGVKPASKAVIKDRTPLIRATVRDAEQDLRRSNVVRVYRDGRAVTNFRFNDSTNTLSFTANTLSYGWHRVRIVVRDAAGERTVSTTPFRVVKRR